MRFIPVLAAVLGFALLIGKTKAQDVDWKGDLEFLVKELKAKHPNPFTIISEEDFDARADELADRINSLGNKEATFELMELVATIGDGHTSVSSPRRDFFRFFPINVKWFEDGIHVRAIDRRHKHLVGAKLVAIGDVSADEVVERFAKFMSHDNLWSVRKRIDKQFQNVEYLERAGLLADKDTVTFHFETESGKESVEMKAIEVKDAGSIRFVNAYAAGLMKKGIFLDLMIKDEQGEPFWNEWIPDHKLVYFKYNQCRNPKEFAKLVKGTAGFVAENDVEKFVLDLRDNAGGSSLVFMPFLKWITDNEELNQKGKLFVIVGRSTFSSGIFAACNMKKTNAIFVGEPTGSKPNHFGEVNTFELPRSGLIVEHSTKSFKLMEDDPETLQPDILIRFTAEDTLAAHDQALQAIFDYKKKED